MADFYKPRQQGGYLPTIMETPDNIVIEGTAYDKITLNPQFLNNLEYNTTNKFLPQIFNRFWNKLSYHVYPNRSYNCDPSSVKFDGGLGIVKNFKYSDYNSNEVYIQAGWSNGRFLKVNRLTNEILANNIMNFPTPQASDWTAYQGQVIFNETSDRIDTITQTDNGPSGNYNVGHPFALYSNSAILSSIIKVTWNNSSITSTLGGAVQPQIVHQDEINTFLTVNGFLNNQNAVPTAEQFIDVETYPNDDKGRHVLFNIDRLTSIMTSLVDIKGESFTVTPGPSAARLDTDADPLNKWFHYWVVLPDITDNFLQFKRIHVNGDNPTTNAVQSVASIDYGPYAIGTICRGIATNCPGVVLRSYTIKSSTDNKEYLGLTICENSIGTGEPLATFKTYIFAIEDGGDFSMTPTLTVLQAMAHDAKPREVFPLNKDWTRVMIITDIYISFLIFDETLKIFIEANRFSISAIAIGIDELDRIWVTDSGGNISLITPFIPTRVNISYELASYNYTGVDINSFVKTSAYDAFGVRIATSIALTIEGANCSFSDGTKSKLINTITTGDVQTNIVVNNSGYFRIIANTQV